MNEQQPNFLDARTIAAIVFVAAAWFLWQSHLEKKYPEANAPQVQSTTPSTVQSTVEGAAPQATTTAPSEASLEKPAEGKTPHAEKILSYEDAHWKFALSSYGMGVRDLTLKTYTDREGNPFAVGVADTQDFRTSIKGQAAPLEFEITQTGPQVFEGVARYQGARITKTMKVNSETYTFDTEVKVEDVPQGFPGLVTSMEDHLRPPTQTGFLAPNAEKYEAYVAHGTTDERTVLKTDESITKSFSDVAILGVSTHYFATAILDQSDLIPTADFQTRPDRQRVVASVTYTPVNHVSKLNLSYRAFAGPKSMTLLKSIDPRMPHMIDFGKFGFIARPLLGLMRWIQTVVGNWGIAIILLTLLVRLIVLPINIFSFRSMKAMQVIQPQLKALREKYKDDPRTLNTETMLLMKKHRVNPLGGCLPMLLQIPVFFALYAVLGESIELYKAPFMFWIQDLSLRDPFYVLPVLMGISMFLQQKLTPTTMDPAQAKVMMFMPLMFSVFMLGLPSGLTLYIFVSTIFGIAQQFVFMRDRTGVAAAPQRA